MGLLNWLKSRFRRRPRFRWSTQTTNFLALVLRSGLLDKREVRDALTECWYEVQASVGSADEMSVVCNYLIKTGRLTEWQCGKLRSGRLRGFFLDTFKLIGYIGVEGTCLKFLAEDVGTKRRVVLAILPRSVWLLKDGKPQYRLEDYPNSPDSGQSES